MSLDVELEEVALTKELHRKQIALGKLRLQVAHLRHIRLASLRDCLVCEADLCVDATDSVVTPDDHTFLLPEPQKTQSTATQYQLAALKATLGSYRWYLDQVRDAFYAGKDFSSGNFSTVPAAPLDVLEHRCRQDDKCAAFASDGSLKRFVPRQLSQLHALNPPDDRPLDMRVDGLYIKRIPRDDSEVTTHAIVTRIPVDKFGPVQVVFDGTGVIEDVPVHKLSVRWTHAYDMSADTWHFVDAVTQIKASAAPEPFGDADSRQREIDGRKRSYAMERDADYMAKKLQSAITLQCAYRNR
ncbi:hypothetical protein DYB36_010782, partial [Aphanomyces astaci]